MTKKHVYFHVIFLGKLDTPLWKAGVPRLYQKNLDYRRKLRLQLRLLHMLKHGPDPGLVLV